MSDRGEALAGCEGFIDYENGVLEVERVCTAPDYRGRGFAKAVICECVRKTTVRGTRAVQISSFSEQTIRFYASFGKHRSMRHLEYRRSVR